MFLGSGDMTVVGFPFARFAITQAQYGCGMVWFNGAGTGTFVYTPGLSVAVVRVQALRGIELFMGYGMTTNILNTRRTFQVVNALMGGNEVRRTRVPSLSPFPLHRSSFFSRSILYCAQSSSSLAAVRPSLSASAPSSGVRSTGAPAARPSTSQGQR